MIDHRIKEAFSEVKKDIDTLKNSISKENKELHELCWNLSKEIKELHAKLAKFEGIKPSTPKIESSTGNQGVQAGRQAPGRQAGRQAGTGQAGTTELSTKELKLELEKRIKSLSKQQFLAFLTIYRLEEDLERGVAYHDLSKKLGVSENRIRTLISDSIKKGLPIIKKKLNNQVISLTIHPNFRELGIKDRLISLFYEQDPDQTKLFDN